MLSAFKELIMNFFDEPCLRRTNNLLLLLLKLDCLINHLHFLSQIIIQQINLRSYHLGHRFKPSKTKKLKEDIDLAFDVDRSRSH